MKLVRRILWGVRRLRRIFRLTDVIGSVHAAQHIVGEEEFSIGRNHHDLQLIRQAFGNNLVNEQRIRLQNCGLALHPFRIGSSGYANAIGFGIRQQLAPLSVQRPA